MSLESGANRRSAVRGVLRKFHNGGATALSAPQDDMHAPGRRGGDADPLAAGIEQENGRGIGTECDLSVDNRSGLMEYGTETMSGPDHLTQGVIAQYLYRALLRQPGGPFCTPPREQHVSIPVGTVVAMLDPAFEDSGRIRTISVKRVDRLPRTGLSEGRKP